MKKQIQSNLTAQPVREPESAEKQLEAFYAGLQQAVDEVDWGKVELPALRDRAAQVQKISWRRLERLQRLALIKKES